MRIIDEIASERQRQINDEGYTVGHDDGHDDESISIAAACYALPPELYNRILYDIDIWPWSGQINRKDRRRDLIRSAALLVAEIERLDRKSVSG